LPGNGALVAAVTTALGRGPDETVGKPAPTLFERAAQRSGAARPLVVGDRLDTDVEGAVRAGMASLLVLTGVATAEDVLTAPPHQRPTHLATDLSGLFTVDSGTEGWRVRRHEAGLELDGEGTPIAALRALCAAAWADSGAPSGLTAGSPTALAALRELGLQQLA
jgi:hypothetical protein